MEVNIFIRISRSKIHVRFVDKWPSTMQRQWFFLNRADGQKFLIGSRESGFSFWRLPLPEPTSPERPPANKRYSIISSAGRLRPPGKCLENVKEVLGLAFLSILSLFSCRNYGQLDSWKSTTLKGFLKLHAKVWGPPEM